MGFFKLGKIDRSAPGGNGKGEHEDVGRDAAAGSGGMYSTTHGAAASGVANGSGAGSGGAGTAGAGASSGSRSAAAGTTRGAELGSAAATAQEKPERKKKQIRQEDTGTAGGAAASGAAAANAGVASSVNDFISKTKSQRRKGLKPSGPELIAYARYLGIDPVADHDLLWIAVEALEAPLPSAWTEHFDSNDRVFYYNASSRVSSWTHPLEQIYRDTYTTIVNFRNSNLSHVERAKQLQQLQAECEQMEREVHREIGLWTEHEDEHGHRFYFNSEEKQSSWTDPRPAKCQILYLKMKLVRNLASGAGTSGFTAGMASGHEASRFAPLSPRKEQEGWDRSAAGTGVTGGGTLANSGAGGGVASDLGTKRPKVGGDQSDSRRGSIEFCGTSSGTGAPAGMGAATGGGHSARGSGATSGAPGAAGGAAATMDSDLLAGGSSLDDSSLAGGAAGSHYFGSDGEVDMERSKKHKKKKKKRDMSAPGDTGVSNGARTVQSLNHSQSEPSVVGKAPPPMAADGGARNSLGPYPSVPQFPGGGGFDAQSESLSTVGRTRVKAGIRLQPLQPISGGAMGAAGEPHEHPAQATVGPGMLGSSSVPELKPLEKLHPL
mmetsp:Transcript_44406/g.78082  ORF Transcript_44406/g.78082 Transcript_44406/m.78082 type:complete len:606 (-) Transcript_44406:51-1868(-)